jgi:hypothetical protein
MEFKEFQSPTEDPVKIFGSNIVHSWMITHEWTQVREDGWANAYAAGCISRDMQVRGLSKEQAIAAIRNEQINYAEQVKAAMEKLIEEGDPDKLDINGKPKTEAIGQIVSQTPTAQMRNAIWKQIQRDKG